MQRLKNFMKYVALTIGTLLFLIFVNIFVLAYININDDKESVYARYVANHLEKNVDENGNIHYALTQEGIDYIDRHKSFAFLMDNSGAVLWEYHMPEELPKQYTIEDAVRFSRYYLKDYPVYTHITDDGIVVLGTQKGTVWKYTFAYQVETMDAYKYALPIMLIVNISVLVLVPFITIKHDQRRREKERTTWIAGVSHDIRTPLSLVIGHAEEIMHIARKNAPTENMTNMSMTDVSENAEGIFKSAQAIEEQAVRIKDLVTNLNTENKLTYGMGSWKKEKVLLPAVIRDTMCEILNRNVEDKYDIRVSISDELEQLYIKGDKELIKRLLENLINNAIIHNPQGCEISITLTKQYAPVLKQYALIISDNGCGANRKQIRRFNARIKSNKLPDHGLGIRLVRQIADFHHWRVRFYNNENGGFGCRINL